MQTSLKRRTIAMALLLLPAMGFSAGAAAQSAWPSKIINYVVPYPPGGTTDIIGRTIAQRLGAALGVTVVVDNKAGATGTIGGTAVARAAPDGYTLLGTSIGPQSIVPHLMPNIPYDPAKSYEPVSLVGMVPHLLIVPANSPYNSVRDLIAAAEAKPEGLMFVSGGNGTILQMQGELLCQQAGVKMIHVPYKGDTPALQDVMGGQVTFGFLPIAAAFAHVQSGKVKALAITAARRAKGLPQVPTMAEAGFADFVVEQWQAIYAPAGTPKSIVQRLNQEIDRILKEEQVVATFEKLGVSIVGGAPQQLADQQKADFERWGKVIKIANIKLE